MDAVQPFRAALWMLGAVASFSAMAVAGREAGLNFDTFEIMLGYATESLPSDRFAGELGPDLHMAMGVLLARFEKRPARAFFAACIEYGRRSERLATVATEFVDGILEPFRRVIGEAIESGRIDGDVDELVSELTGPIMLDHVILGRSISSDRGAAAVSEFVARHG